MEGSISGSSSFSAGSSAAASRPRIEAGLVNRAFGRTRAAEWGVAEDVLRPALETSVAKAFAGRDPSPGEIARYVDTLHLDDLALAAACAEGSAAAWEVFVREYRPVLYRAADAIDRTGAARELADSLYAELYGLNPDGRARASLFRYFHGRSTLATWLRAVLAQRLVDARRSTRRLDPLPDEELPASPPEPRDPGSTSRAGALKGALRAALLALTDRDRLRLLLYYAHGLTLAAIGRQFGEHEATVSRQIARIRRVVKDDVERRLRDDHHFDAANIEQCWREAITDAGTFDLAAFADPPRKNSEDPRSENEGTG